MVSARLNTASPACLLTRSTRAVALPSLIGGGATAYMLITGLRLTLFLAYEDPAG